MSGKPSSSNGCDSSCGSVGSETIVILSSTIFSPILLPLPLLDERTASFVSRTRVGVTPDELHEIAYGVRLENRAILPFLIS